MPQMLLIEPNLEYSFDFVSNSKHHLNACTAAQEKKKNINEN